jgi:hypothetical protein
MQSERGIATVGVKSSPLPFSKRKHEQDFSYLICQSGAKIDSTSEKSRDHRQQWLIRPTVSVNQDGRES